MDLKIESSSLDLPPQRTSIDAQWDPGLEGVMTINTDGSVNPLSKKATAGGLIRDYLGRCYLAFSSNLGSCTISRAELHGIAMGLHLAWNAGYRSVIVQSDSKTALALVLAEGKRLSISTRMR
ncbi:Putative ribonuclease H protein At1g65750 [Linum perenne]